MWCARHLGHSRSTQRWQCCSDHSRYDLQKHRIRCFRCSDRFWRLHSHNNSRIWHFYAHCKRITNVRIYKPMPDYPEYGYRLLTSPAISDLPRSCPTSRIQPTSQKRDSATVHRPTRSVLAIYLPRAVGLYRHRSLYEVLFQ